MYSRIQRRNITPIDLGIEIKNTVPENIDSIFKIYFRLYEDEYLFLTMHLSDLELNIFASMQDLNFSEKRYIINTIKRVLNEI